MNSSIAHDDKNGVKTFEQETANTSPWSVKDRVLMLLWECSWAVLCRWTPKPFNQWRLFWLRLFGATIEGRPFVHQRARIQIPWNLTLRDRSCLGDRANLYTLGEIEIGARAIVAQEAYLCTGTHDLTVAHVPLRVAKITVGDDVFVGARAFVMPGISIGDGAIIGACSVVTKNVPKRMLVAGNPARTIREVSRGLS
jgi:putative colanic acid biosynthesis acetyltransferase WcaF